MLVLSGSRPDMVYISESQVSNADLRQRSGTGSEDSASADVVTTESRSTDRKPSEESRRSSAGSGSSFENIGALPLSVAHDSF